MNQPILEMKEITKTYPNGVIANNKARLCVNRGEIHSVIGENGAGKTTLMKILFGLETADSGEIIFDGEKIERITPQKAISKGIGMVHQHFALAPSITVLENFIVGKEPTKHLQIYKEKAEKDLMELSEKYGLHVEARAILKNTPIGMRQRLEILKVLYRGARFLILDEPTAVLTPQEIDDLFKALNNLRDAGYTVVFISHKLLEVLKISDRITVMRGGKTVGEVLPGEVDENRLSKMMVGRDVVFEVQKPPSKPGDVVLKVSNLNYWSSDGKHAIKSFNLNLREGEILGIAGVEGNGQRELIDVIGGLKKADEGTITITGVDSTEFSPKEVRNLGVGIIPEDRLVQGVAIKETIEENLIGTCYDKLPTSLGVLMKKKDIHTLGNKLINEFGIVADSGSTGVSMLSGGNIQKVVVARELSFSPKLLLVNQPTRGVDVGSIEFIHSRLISASRSGTAVLLVSSELREVLSLSDKLIIMYEGEVVAVFSDTRGLTEEELGLYMLGAKKRSQSEIMEGLS